MTKYKGIVKWNGNHYEAGEEVIGSRIVYDVLDGDDDDATLISEFSKKFLARPYRIFLYDDEPINEFPYYGEARNEWVEIESFEELGE